MQNTTNISLLKIAARKNTIPNQEVENIGNSKKLDESYLHSIELNKNIKNLTDNLLLISTKTSDIQMKLMREQKNLIALEQAETSDHTLKNQIRAKISELTEELQIKKIQKSEAEAAVEEAYIKFKQHDRKAFSQYGQTYRDYMNHLVISLMKIIVFKNIFLIRKAILM